MSDEIGNLLRRAAHDRAESIELAGTSQVWGHGRRLRRRNRTLVGVGALGVGASLAAGATLLQGAIDDRPRLDQAAPAEQADGAAPNETALRRGFQVLPQARVDTVELIALQGQPGGGPWESPGRTFAADAVDAAITLDVDGVPVPLGVQWARVDPPVTAAENDRLAQANPSGSPSQQMVPAAPVVTEGEASSRVYTGPGGFTRVWAWSTSGGVASAVGGGGPYTLKDAERVAAVLRSLLAGN
jgi:hypothetical protein